MRLFNIDYTKKLNDEDKKLYDKLKKEDNLFEPGFNWIDESKKVRHYASLFPNNFLDRYEIIETDILSQEKQEFLELLNSNNVNERKILNYINNSHYHVMGCLLKRFPFGHHGAYLFNEFKLGTSFQADYLLIGDASDGYHMIFVELEAPNGKIVTKDGRFSININSGIDQVKDWKVWLEKNYNLLKEFFVKNIRTDINLPSELYEYDSTRIFYVVVSGRRKDYNDKTYRLRRELEQNYNIYVLHYDNLVDCIDCVNINDKKARNY